MKTESLFVNTSFRKGIQELLNKIVLKTDAIERGQELTQIRVTSLEPFYNYFNQEMNKTNGEKSSIEIGQFIGSLMDKQWKGEKFQLEEIKISTNEKGEFTVSFKGLKHMVSIHVYMSVAKQGVRYSGPLADVNVGNTNPPQIRKLYCCWYF
jgi:hypothetical protein